MSGPSPYRGRTVRYEAFCETCDWRSFAIKKVGTSRSANSHMVIEHIKKYPGHVVEVITRVKYRIKAD